MVEFGDELIIENFKLPWLIWIQILVMILLVILLFSGFALFSLDESCPSAVASPSAASNAAPPVNLNSAASSDAITKVEDQRVRRDVGTSGIPTRQVEQSREESSFKDSSPMMRIFRLQNHPCNYFGLAKQALFKCFGLDSSSESSTKHQHEKQE